MQADLDELKRERDALKCEFRMVTGSDLGRLSPRAEQLANRITALNAQIWAMERETPLETRIA